MHDLWRILEASSKTGCETTALATVVRTSGSTYRRAGARMLITAEGETIGAVSGGCLEAKIAARAHEIIHGAEPCVLSFDTRLTHGCYGLVEVLIEPLAKNRAEFDVLGYAARLMAARKSGVIVSIFCNKGQAVPPLGSFGLEGATAGDLPWEVHEDGIAALENGRSTHRCYEWGECFFNVLHPPVRLVIIGGGHDVVPLVELGQMLGWDLSVVTHPGERNLHPRLAEVIPTETVTPAMLAQELQPDAHTAVVVMTHHFGRDLAFLETLLPLPIPYLGLLGPKRRREQIIAELASVQGSFDPECLSKLHSPMGFDLGAESPEEIALSIAAEIRAVLAGRSGKPLRECKGPIHDVRSGSANSTPIPVPA